jgi:hypothetical protein
MKLLIRLLPIFLVSGFISCQKEISFEPGQNGGGSGTGVNGILKMKIDGKQWVADKAAGASLMVGMINISGLGNDKKTFTITLSDTVARTYILSNQITSIDSAHFAALYDSVSVTNDSWSTVEGDDPALAGGWLNIAKIDKVKKTMSGSFQFKLYREMDSTTLTITEGVFENLSYTTTLPPASATDTFRVKINGTSWNPASLVGLVNFGSISVVANEASLNKTVGLTMPADITTGSYTFDFLGGQYIGAYNPNPTTTLASTSGTLTILEHNTSTKRIRGNFNFVAEPVLGGTGVNLTEGYFSVKYQ